MTLRSLPARQRGVAALLVTALLCLATILVVTYAGRHLVADERASAVHLRTAQAFEAAEAGIEWAQARLNDPTRAGADCRPSADPSAAPLRARWLRPPTIDGRFDAATWDDGGTPAPVRAACVRGAAGWTCSCPADGPTALSPPAGPATAPTFTIEFATVARAGVVRIVATGCTRSDAECLAGGATAHDAAARVEATLALLPAIRSAPVAALSVRGDVGVGTAALGVHQRDGATGGLALHAGGAVAASALRLTAPAGSALDASVVAGDTALAGLDADRFFSRWFAMSVSAWGRQPAVSRVACAGECSAALFAAVAAGSRLLFVDGDAAIDGPAAFGAPDDPVVLVVRGALTLTGPVGVNGVVHAGSLRWHAAAAPAAFVRGAALVAGDFTGDAAADIDHDTAILDHLRRRAGSFVRVNGSWKDF